MRHTFQHETEVNMSLVRTTDDGALIMNAAPMRVGQMLHFGIELPDALREELGVDFDQEVMGEYERDTVLDMAGQMKATAITNGHIFLEEGDRKNFAIGALLDDGELDDDGLVRTEATIYDPQGIAKINNGVSQLSTGGEGEFIANPNRGRDGAADFFVRNVTLNHVALVELGRAGPTARLANALKLKESKMFTIGNRKFENEAAAAEFVSGLETKITTLEAAAEPLDVEVASLQNQVAELTTERDTARGELATAIATIENSDPIAEAKRMADEHAAFVNEATALGHDAAGLELGAYDVKATKLQILNSLGIKLAEDASDDAVSGSWNSAVSLGSTGDKKPASVLNSQGSKPKGEPLLSQIANRAIRTPAKKDD